MIEKFPKFLEKRPEFFGLDLWDISLIGLLLLLALILGMTPIEVLILILSVLALLKLLRNRFPNPVLEPQIIRTNYLKWTHMIEGLRRKEIML